MAFITAASIANLDLDRLIDSICAAYPEAKIKTRDYYADRLARELEIARQLAIPVTSSVIESTRRAAERHGLQREIVIPIRIGVFLTGRLDRLGVLFATDKRTTSLPTLAEVRCLIDLLTSEGLKLEVDGFPNAP
jgi:hypothetical protein